MSNAVNTVYGIIMDCGDGSSAMAWYRNRELVEFLLNDDEYCELYYQNEGSPSQTLSFPASLDLEQCGFSFDDDEYTRSKNGRWHHKDDVGDVETDGSGD